MSLVWGKVVDLDPLTVQIATDTTALTPVGKSLVHPDLLTVGDRVRCEMTGGPVIIHGLAGGFEVPPQIGFRLVEVLRFTSSGTFSKADYPWLRAVRVRVQAGGGGGGGAVATSAQNAVGYGGGGGGYAESLIEAGDLGSSETVTVGAGGSSNSGAAGGDGGNSSFGSLVTATGGTGGSLTSATTGAAGSLGGNGGGGTGDLVIPGVQGGAGITESSLSAPGAGGGAFLSSGFALPRWPVRAGNTSNGGLNGSVFGYGAGGSGGINRGTQSAVSGGSGGDGIVIVELFA